MPELRYITLEDIRKEVPEIMQGLLTDDTPQGDMPHERVIKECALSAEQEFESYASSRYELPVKAEDGTVPVKVKKIIYKLVKYELYGRRNGITDNIQVQYDAAVTWLRRLQKGDVSLPLLDENDEVVSDGGVDLVVGEGDESQFKEWV